MGTPDGEQTITCPSNMTVLDAAQDQGLELPYSCLTGECSICSGRVLEGTIDQSEQKFLTEEQLEQSYCLTCVTKPTSHCRIKTHVDGEVGPDLSLSEEELKDAKDFGFGGGDSDDGALL